MPESYPLPSYAVSLWIAGDDLWLAFPGQGPEGRGHSVRLPASVGGLQAAIKILRARETAEDLRIAQRGTPTQYDLERIAEYMLKSDHAAKQAERREAKAAAAAELAELGL